MIQSIVEKLIVCAAGQLLEENSKAHSEEIKTAAFVVSQYGHFDAMIPTSRYLPKHIEQMLD